MRNPFSWLRNFVKRQNPFADRWYSTSSGGQSFGSQTINAETALANADYLASVRVISETVAGLPFFVYKRVTTGNKRKERVPKHPLSVLIKLRPNAEMTSMQWREQIILDLLAGRHYSHVVFDNVGNPTEIVPLPRNQVTRKRSESGALIYEFKPEKGPKIIFSADKVLDIAGPLGGKDLTALMAESIGLSMSATRHGTKVFQNSAAPGGFFEDADALLGDEDEQKRFLSSWNKKHRGVNSTGKIAFLPAPMRWKSNAWTPEEAQMLESRRFSKSEIAGIMRVPPHMIGEMSSATFSNIENLAIQFAMFSIQPWLKRIEQAMNHFFFPDENFFVEFQLAGLLRGDMKSRSEGLAIQRDRGIINADEWRDLENMNPQPAGQGQTYWMPFNMQDAAMLADPNALPEEDGEAATRAFRDAVRRKLDLSDLDFDLLGGKPSAPSNGRNGGCGCAVGAKMEIFPGLSHAIPVHVLEMRGIRDRLIIRNSFRPQVLRATDRIVASEVAVLRSRAADAGGDIGAFRNAVDDYYGNEYPATFSDRLKGPLGALIAASSAAGADQINSAAPGTDELDDFTKEYIDNSGVRHAASGAGQLKSLETQDEIEERLDEWDEKRSDKITQREHIEAAEAAVKLAFVFGGVTLLRWQAVGENCPFCDEIDGKVVGIESNFVNGGDEVDPGGDTQPLRKRSDVSHPPLHQDCDCVIQPG